MTKSDTVLACLTRHAGKALSTQDIADETGLSRPEINKICCRLYHLGKIELQPKAKCWQLPT